MAFRLRFPALLLVLCACTARSQDAGPAGSSAGGLPKAVAFIVPRPQGGEQDAPFLHILAGAMEIDLHRAGLRTRTPETALLPVLALAPLSRLLEEAAGADFLVLERYTSGDQAVRLDVEVLRAADGRRIAAASTRRNVDLRLDEAVSEVVRLLLPQLQTEIAQAVARRRLAEETRPPGDVALEELAPAEGEPEDLGPAGPQEAPSGPEAAQPQPEAAELPAQPPEAGRKARVDRRLEAGAGGGVFFPVTDLAPLFRVGYQAEAYLAYRLRRPAAPLALGVYAGFAGLRPEQQGTASFFDALVPIGADLRLGTSERSRWGAHLRVQAGGVLNVSSQTKVDQRLTRVLPQVKAGAGLRLALSPRLGVALEMLYELMLYMYLQDGRLHTEPLMGFEGPSVYVYTRW